MTGKALTHLLAIALAMAAAWASVNTLAASGREHVGGSAGDCGPARALTLAQNQHVRVFGYRDRFEGVTACLHSTREVSSLDAPPEAYAYRGPTIALAGTTVGWAIDTCGEPPCVTRLHVRDLEQPSRERVTGSGRGDRPTRIGSVRVKTNGALAWIACPARAKDPNFTPVADRRPNCIRAGAYDSVFKLDSAARKPSRLDSGHRIDPSSLRLRGSTLSWSNNGRRHSAMLR